MAYTAVSIASYADGCNKLPPLYVIRRAGAFFKTEVVTKLFLAVHYFRYLISYLLRHKLRTKYWSYACNRFFPAVQPTDCRSLERKNSRLLRGPINAAASISPILIRH